MSAQMPQLPAKLTMEERKRLTLTDATEVIRFNEDLVELNTSLGPLIVEGSELRLKCLSLDDGTVVIQGNIRALSYEEPKLRRGFFR